MLRLLLTHGIFFEKMSHHLHNLAIFNRKYFFIFKIMTKNIDNDYLINKKKAYDY